MTDTHTTQPTPRLQAVHIAVLLLLCLTLITVFDLPIDHAEAQALWVVDDIAPVWDVAPRDALRGIRANVTDMIERVPETGLPPVYFGVLDGWTMAFGESLFVARLLSVFATVAGIAVILRVAHHFDPTINRTGVLIIAGLLAPIMALTIHVYGVLLFFASLAAWMLVLWCNHPRITVFRSLIYLLSLCITLTIAHVTLPVLLVHGVVAWRAQRLRLWGILFALSLVLITPIMLLFAPSDTGVFGTIMFLQVSFFAAISVALPFAVLIFAYNLRSPAPIGIYVGVIVLFIVSVGFMLNKPDWRGTIDTINTQRDTTNPAISAIDPQSIPAYYDRQNRGLSSGITIDVGWRVFTPDEISTIIDNMENAPSIWVFLPENDPNTATIPEQLSETRTVGYSERIDGMHLQRFDLNE